MYAHRSRGSTKIFAIDRRPQAKSLLRLDSDDLVVAMPKSCADARRHASFITYSKNTCALMSRCRTV